MATTWCLAAQQSTKSRASSSKMRNKEIEATFFLYIFFLILHPPVADYTLTHAPLFKKKKGTNLLGFFFFWFVECCDGGGGGLFNIKEMVLEERLLPRLSAWTTMTATLLVASRTKSNSRTVE